MTQARRTALWVAGTYAVLSLTWVLASDLLVSTLLPEPLQASMQSTKGLAFVAVTTVVMYLIVERFTRRAAVETRHAGVVEKMLEQVVSTVPVGVVLTADDGAITFMNLYAEHLLGVSGPEAAGRRLDEVCCSDCSDCADGTIAFGELFRTGSVDGVRIEGSAVRAARSVAARAQRVNPEEPASGWVIALADVTDAQRALSAAERLVGGYRFLALALDAAARTGDEASLLKQLAQVAVESGRYAGAWAALTDGASEPVDVAMVGLGPRTREIAAMMRELAVREPGRMPLRVGEVVASNDVARDPANVWYSGAVEDGFGSLAALALGTGGRLVGALTLVSRDAGGFDAAEMEVLHSLLRSLDYELGRIMLERKRLDAEEALEGSERGYRELFEHNPAVMWIYDRDTHRILAVNNAAVAKYGYSREEFLRLSIDAIRPAADVPRLNRQVKDRSGGFDDAGVWTHRDAAGREFPVHVYVHHLLWEGRQAVLVMVMEVARIGD